MQKNRKYLLLILSLLTVLHLQAQTLQQGLQNAFTRLQHDAQCRYATLSLTVLDAQTGEVVFTGNPDVGLAPASTLKTVTAITSFYVLGKDFQYQTQLGYNGHIDADGTLTGDIIIKGAGDPTLGSWRWENTKEPNILAMMTAAIRQAGIKKVNGRIIGDESVFGSQSIPEGWIQQDMGNYYGAGTSGLCWRENQFDIKLSTGAVGSKVGIAHTVPAMPYYQFKSELTMVGDNSGGDNAYVYLPVGNNTVYLRGTYGGGDARKSIAAALPDPAFDAAFRLNDTLIKLGISVSNGPESVNTLTNKNQPVPAITGKLTTISSPTLSKMVYWMDQKSINLYAEQLLKTLALKLGKTPSTSDGADFVHDFWKARGIDPNSLNTIDGSGLSPGNRVTTQSMARILQSAKKEPWFADFYESLPLYNNMKMKSGTINNGLAFAGYQTHGGKQLCFSIIVNNYNGSASAMRQKLFRVLDELK
ncbi:D-alanyl-D-alanine carboxypeptidase/D-alanyl-D-alanine-endopeptidase (penicillin-binding protein 4) [Mucilaginibacter yixingensis]|uniref:D-alanyl-D-alanine carboxypeptidase/D-alanyl-D-alanine-endopeptidase (Penicillin-binding protein 4) n=1 Tax=Mucilaginibacter yixingensis TaxID=1295612 RepID=A0A2T5J6A4_9SPHI|nr:D-alanyl-D-alanine carboxypeptidase/D-alanyl-D-alanine-endopeptidase [Mucilaginibacter yixingensis]PTQ94070.1 D-alanyl-D-alanine carboxypeptidase/D-alanyl-D-alanine-endopeptidase (penicillin-binding protein 4) [Mucilaginibacter yixingensis]